MLLLANYEDKRMNIGSQLFLIKKGQFIASYKFLRNRWAYMNDHNHMCTPSPNTVKAFLDLLVEEKMIERDTKKLPTSIMVITVCNYNDYQQVIKDKVSNRNNGSNNGSNKEYKNIDKKRIINYSQKELGLFQCASPKGLEKFDFSIVDKMYIEPLIMWLTYKRSRNEMYKNQASFQQLYKKMLRIGSPEAVKEAVENSIANNYVGLFKDKNYGNNQKEQREREVTELMQRIDNQND